MSCGLVIKSHFYGYFYLAGKFFAITVSEQIHSSEIY